MYEEHVDTQDLQPMTLLVVASDVSKKSSLFTDSMALAAMKAIGSNIRTVYSYIYKTWHYLVIIISPPQEKLPHNLFLNHGLVCMCCVLMEAPV